MKYVADALTFLRYIAALTIAVLALFIVFGDHDGLWPLVMTLFIVGILSDALDGPAARQWPYRQVEERRMWWRKDSHKWDNNADLALSSAVFGSLAFSQLSWLAAIAVLALVGGLSALIDANVQKLRQPGKFHKAEWLDVFHGWIYALELIAGLVLITILATDSWPAWTMAYALASAVLLVFKWDRATTRPEVYHPKQ